MGDFGCSNLPRVSVWVRLDPIHRKPDQDFLANRGIKGDAKAPKTAGLYSCYNNIM